MQQNVSVFGINFLLKRYNLNHTLLFNWHEDNKINLYLHIFSQVQEMEQTIPTTAKVKFDNPDILHEFAVVIHPDEGFWKGGKFVFLVTINEDYNISVNHYWSFHME